MKKVLAAVLAFAMVVTGMYFVKPEASEVKAATTVPADMLDIKLQAIGGANKTMRLITSVDSLDYKEVGFIVNNGTDEKKMSTTTVFEKIKSSVEGETYNFSPKLIGSSSEYFATVKFDVAYPDNTYTVQAYVITNDDQEIKGREIRSFQYNDGTATTTVNLLVEGTLEQGVTATYGPNADGTGDEAASVTVLTTNDGYTSVRVALADGTTVDDLKSATRFTFSDGSTAVYRNLYTTHVPASGTTPVADTSWYDVNPEAEEFVIATGADLYGFAAVQNSATSYDTNTYNAIPKITLVGDIEINKGEATVDGWVPTEGEAKYLWTMIGNAYYGRFDGTFDGDGNTISGIVLEASSSEQGFIKTGEGQTAKIQNLQFVNSYLQATFKVGIVPVSYGVTFENVYSNAIVKATHANNTLAVAGGFVGAVARTNRKHEFINCWFDGIVTGQYCVGGFVGINEYSSSDPKTGHQFIFTNCLSTGTVNAINKFAGGMLGTMHSWGSATFTNCVSTATVTATNGGIGSLAGTTSSSKAYYYFLPGCYSTVPASTMEIVSQLGSYTTALGNATTANLEHVLVAPEGYYTTAETLTNTELATLFQTYEGVSSSADWAKVNVNGTVMPVPATFANWYNAQ